MSRSCTALGAVSAAASAAVLALSVGLCAVGSAHADSPEPTATAICEGTCEPSTSESPTPDTTRKPDPKPTEEPSIAVKPPPAPAPAPPAKPVPTAPPAEPALPPEPTLQPVPSETEEASPSSSVEATTSSSIASATTPSTESNWNKPIATSAKATPAAAVSTGDGPGFGDPGVLTIMAGVFLVGLAGLAFAWWGRHRASTH